MGRLNRQILKDVTFLRELGIMDYSLLVGIHKVTDAGQKGPNQPPKLARNTQRRSSMLADHPEWLQKFQYGITKASVIPENSPLAGADLTTALSSKMFDKPIKDGYKPRFGSNQHQSKGQDFSGLDFTGQDPNLQGGSPLVESGETEAVVSHWTTHNNGFKGKGPQGEEEVYYFGIIDILITYNTKKKFETWYRCKQGNEMWTVSCVDPFTYSERFRRYMSNGVM